MKTKNIQAIKQCITLCLVCFMTYACANKSKETVTFIVNVPESTPKNKSVYISGNFENWAGGQDAYQLKEKDEKHYIRLPQTKDTLQYKFTLGSWASVEQDTNGNDIENRTYTFTKPNDTITLDVSRWKTSENTLVLPKHVQIFKDSMYIPQLKRKRRIWVYTPPSYKTSTKSYPVIYMHDAQNLFTNSTSYAGEWQVDEILTQLSKENGLELIVVGIDHGEEERLNEMSPWVSEDVKNPQGDLYLDFVVNILKPEIDKAYRTKSNTANTGILGASMGGLISHYAGFEYPNIFGKIGVFSPSYWISEKVFTHTSKHSLSRENRLYLLIGSDEGADMLPNAQRMRKLLASSADFFEGRNFLYNEVKGVKHNEALWRSHLAEALCWLFGKPKPKPYSPFDFASNNPVTKTTLSSGKLHRLDGYFSQYIKTRPVDVWLPNDYSEDKTNSVLYMHDGQMLFDAKTTWNNQEWKVDEWASQLMSEEKTKDFIVVGIHSISDIRWQDLFPQKAINYVDKESVDALTDISGNKDFKLNGDNYLKFLIKELKPYIDKTYNVHTDKVNTFVMGSSMGGLMSMYALSEYPEIFAGAACLSTHWVGARPIDNNPFPEVIFKYMAEHIPEAGTHKLYFDYGNKTLDAHYPQYAPEVDRILKVKGYSENNSRNLFFENTNHSENAWNQRLDVPLVFLMGKD